MHDPSPLVNKRRFSPNTVPKYNINTENSPIDELKGISLANIEICLGNTLNISNEATNEQIQIQKSTESLKIKPVELSEDEESYIFK